MKHFSLSRKWILLSLVLLSPEILAAESLNFNYKRADTLSLEPRFGLQARGCHAPVDPMNISFMFRKVEMSNEGTKGLRVKLVIKGADFPKSYTVFTSASGATKAAPNPESDKELLVPWGVTIQGTSEGNTGHYQMTVPFVRYENPFCFSESVADIGGTEATKSLQLYPIYRYREYGGNINPFYDTTEAFRGNSNSTWDRYCKDKDISDSRDKWYYWPNYYNPPAGADNADEYGNTIWAYINKTGPDGGVNYLTNHMFYGGKVSSGTTPIFSSQHYSHNVKPETESNPIFTYTFPVGQDVTSFVKNGDYLLKLNNRAIISMTLTLYDGSTKKESVFEWKRSLSGPKPIDNILRYQSMSIRDFPVSPFPPDFLKSEENDPYEQKHFYLDSVYKNYFRGTLVTKNNLNQAYDDYNKNIAPLSLPTETPGDINLANTDSLTFIIAQKDFNGNYLVVVDGSPVKFGPLYTINKYAIAASAMQMRNACY
ncbi:TPA: hypothetical protein ACLFMC_003578 [Salmonella enterica subsp. diarizonae serovar 61:l,v:z35]